MLICCFRLNVEVINKLRHLSRLVSATFHGSSQLSVLHLPLESFTAYDRAISRLGVVTFAYYTCI